MSWYYYEDTRALKEKVHRDIERRRKRGETFEVLDAPQGNRKLVTTFWGKAWCQHLEAYKDYEYRLPRGRSYLRQGNVYNLEIEPGIITATVAGSSLYDVSVKIAPLAPAAWKGIKQDCAGQVASLLDLLGGRLGDGVLRAITDPERGLFPKPREIKFSCSCPDWADLCKHVAAVLYGVGVKFDAAPDLFFVLRSVDPSELLGTAAQETLSQVQGADSALAGEDLSALFGIDLATVETPLPETPKKPKAKAKAKPKAKVKAKPTAKTKAKAAAVSKAKPVAANKKGRRPK